VEAAPLDRSAATLQFDVGIGMVRADGAVMAHRPPTLATRADDILVIIPPDMTAVLNATAYHHPSKRNPPITLMALVQRGYEWSLECDPEIRI
jgi:hypothetical protein